MAKALETPGLISLAAGFVDQESLPSSDLAPELRTMLSDPIIGRAMLQYGSTQGDLELRRVLNERMREEGVFHPHSDVDESCFLIGSGSQQILYLAAEAFLDPGDIVLLEAPTYFVTLGAFETRGARTVGIETDAGGLDPQRVAAVLADLEAQGELHRVKMLYVMTYATNPQGLTLAEERRKPLLDLLQQYGAKGYPILLLEDAAYRRLCFDAPPPTVKSFEESNDLVLYTESFSKSLSPGLRLGVGVGPKAVIDKMIHLKGNHDFGSANFSQMILLRALTCGLFDAHVEQLRHLYRDRCDHAVELAQKYFPPETRWLKPSGGFYLWVDLPGDLDAGVGSPLLESALQEGVLYVPGNLCFSPDRPEARRSASLRLAFGKVGGDDLEEGVKRLGRAVSRVFAAIS